MDAVPAGEFERILFFESARQKAEADYANSPHDTENLTKWGRVLLELAHFQQGQGALSMISDAISKFEEALKIAPEKHDTLWCLGNACTSQGFLVPDTEESSTYFKKAMQCFQQALSQDPLNELYKKALEMSEKAPSLHKEIQKQLCGSQTSTGISSPVSTSGSHVKVLRKAKKKSNNDLKYDVMGWIVLAIGVAAWAGMAKTTMQALPQVP
eukprot:c19325_g1_i1 orf=493-1128(-)